VTWRSLQAGMKITGGQYLSMIEELQRFSRKLARFLRGQSFDLLLSPTMATPPTELGAFTPEEKDPAKVVKAVNAFVAFTRVQNITGDPAMSVPLFWNEQNVPIGVQFAARFGDESSLFRLAGQLEKEKPWYDKKPPIHRENLQIHD
jgi:Asp-tRNA(Asn)/Glu-tRNA(Gln) amidotransferase A subunit family amidase